MMIWREEIISLAIEILNFHKGEFKTYEDRMNQKKKFLENKKKEKEKKNSKN